MIDTLLLSTAYFPPYEYFSLIALSNRVLIEKWENYTKQTYRNRCVILGANGPMELIVPVLRGSFHKTALKDIEIDNSRRWRSLHLRGIASSYAAAPYFEYYYEAIRNVITKDHRFLLDLNMEALSLMTDLADLRANIKYTNTFIPQGEMADDYRYLITPKKPCAIEDYEPALYIQVFSERFGFVPGLSIIDVLLNNGPATRGLLLRSMRSGI